MSVTSVQARFVRSLGFWGALVLPGLAPLVCPYPPFQDWPAHVGVVGALARMDEPAARILTHFEYTGWFKLNMLFHVTAWGLSELADPITAANLCLAMALGSLAPAVWLLCRSLDADPRFALLATPLALGRHVYCGFGPNAAALPLFVLGFALYFVLRKTRHPYLAGAGLLVVWLALAWMHAFVFLAGAGLMALLIMGDTLRPPRWSAGVALGALLAAAGLLALLHRQGLGVADQSAGAPWEALWQAVLQAPRDDLGPVFWGWLFASYRYQRLDDLLQIVWLVGLTGAIWSAWALDGAAWWRTGRAAMLGLAVVALAMFVVLPESVGPPLNWWGARLRLPPLVALLCLPLVSRKTSRELGPFVPMVVATSVLTVGLGLYDLSAFHRTYNRNFGEVLDAMPPGQRISLLHFTTRAINEYPGEPFGYFGNYYVAAKGGVVPQDFFERRELPFRRRFRLPSPPWGAAGGFRWPQHARGFDGFLVKTDPARGSAAFFKHERAMKLERDVGAWRYYRLVDAP